MNTEELQRSGKWDWIKDCPLPGYSIEVISEPTKAEPARPDSDSEKDVLIRRLEGRCKQMSKQLKESHHELVRLRRMHHLEVAGYVKYTMIGMMVEAQADHTTMYSSARQQFNYPVYRVRIRHDEPAT